VGGEADLGRTEEKPAGKKQGLRSFAQKARSG